MQNIRSLLSDHPLTLLKLIFLLADAVSRDVTKPSLDSCASSLPLRKRHASRGCQKARAAPCNKVIRQLNGVTGLKTL